MRDRDKIIDRRGYIPSFMNDKTFRQKAEYIHYNTVSRRETWTPLQR